MKIASIDVGTNTVILLIAEIRHYRITTLRNEYKIPRIGKGLTSNKLISDEKIQELIHILLEFNTIIKLFNCDVVLATGTNAFRIASNALEIVQTVKDRVGIQINIVTNLKEAEYSFYGAVSDYYDKDNDYLVVDIGGGSTELICGQLNKIKYINSFQTGVVSATESFFKHDPPLPSEIINFDNFLSNTFIDTDISNKLRAIAIAGTPTTLACIQKRIINYNEDDIEGSILKQADVFRLKEELSHLSSKQIKEKYKQIVSGREDVLLAGTIILNKLMEYFNLTEVIVSTKGIRYGAIVEYMRTNYN